MTIKCQTYAGSTFVVIQHIPKNDPCNRNIGTNLNVNKCDKQKLHLQRWILNGMKIRYIDIFSYFTIHLTWTLHSNVKFMIRVHPLKRWWLTSIKNYTDRVIGFKYFALDKFHLNSLPKFTLHFIVSPCILIHWVLLAN